MQAVQAQDPPGRFLERNKKDKMWYSVSYKKAVDKTSQGLREKERGDEVYQSPLPPMLANRSPKIPANLHDLAMVTMARAGLDPILPQSQNKRPPPLDKEVTDINRTNKRPKAILPTKSFLKPKAASPPVATTPTLQEWDEPLPLPTQPLQARQSSMFRFLSQTVLLNDAISSNSNVPGTSTIPSASFANPSASFMSAPAVAAAFAAAHTSNKAPAAPAQWFYGPPMLPLPPPPPPAVTNSSVVVPAESTVLTRLTSQFSDLFATFWPQPSTNNINNNHQNRHQNQREAIQTAAETAATMMSFATAPASTTLTGTDSGIIECDIASVTSPTLFFSKSASSLPTICNDDDGDDRTPSEVGIERVQSEILNDIADDDDDIKPIVASELERSASATLLKLASNPTTFFSNLTDFFQRSTTTAAKSSQIQQDDISGLKEEGNGQRGTTSLSPYFYEVPPTTMVAAASNASKSRAASSVSSSLGLAVAKRSNASLLDDYEESPLETRLRSVRSG